MNAAAASTPSESPFCTPIFPGSQKTSTLESTDSGNSSASVFHQRPSIRNEAAASGTISSSETLKPKFVPITSRSRRPKVTSRSSRRVRGLPLARKPARSLMSAGPKRAFQPVRCRSDQMLIPLAASCGRYRSRWSTSSSMPEVVSTEITLSSVNSPAPPAHHTLTPPVGATSTHASSPSSRSRSSTSRTVSS